VLVVPALPQTLLAQAFSMPVVGVVVSVLELRLSVVRLWAVLAGLETITAQTQQRIGALVGAVPETRLLALEMVEMVPLVL
jgi:hypothetical protein